MTTESSSVFVLAMEAARKARGLARSARVHASIGSEIADDARRYLADPQPIRVVVTTAIIPPESSGRVIDGEVPTRPLRHPFDASDAPPMHLPVAGETAGGDLQISAGSFCNQSCVVPPFHGLNPTLEAV